MTPEAQTLILTLQMLPHPEGGFYKETYRSNHLMDVTMPVDGAVVRRSVSTGIYFLLEQGNFSAFHKIQSDEMWHFYAGDRLVHHSEVIGIEGESYRTELRPA